MASPDDELKIDLYWKMYNEHATQARHHEILRGTISTILVAVCAGVLSAYSAKNGAEKLPFHTGFMLIALGTLGGLLSYKHYERNRLHVSILRQFRKKIDEILHPLGGSLSAPNSLGRKRHECEYPRSSKWLRAYFLWMAVFIFFVLAGVMIAWGPTTRFIAFPTN